MDSSKPLLAETALALLGRNVALVDLADLGSRRAGVELRHELTERALVALGLSGDLSMVRDYILPYRSWAMDHTLPSLEFFT